MTLLTYREAAVRLSIGERTLDRLVSRREILVTKVRSGRRISDAEIDRYIKANTERADSGVFPFSGRRSR